MNTSTNTPSPTPTPSPDKPEHPAMAMLQKLGNFLLLIIVTPFMLANELRKELERDVYSGWAGGFRAVFGGLLGVAAAGFTGHFLGWTLHWNAPAWLSCGALSWFATYWYAWPLFYLFPVKPSIKLAELVNDGFHNFAQNYAGKFFKDFVPAVAEVLPGSSALWNKILSGQKRNNWVSQLTVALAFPVTIAGSACLGYSLFKLVAACFAWHVPGITLGVGAGVVAGLSLLGLVFQLIEQGELSFVTVAMALGLDRIFSSQVAAVSTLAHLSNGLSLISHVLAVLVFVGYVYPLVNLALSGGWIKSLIDRLQPLCDKAYNDRDADYVSFFHNVITLVLGAIVVVKAFAWASAIALPVWALVPVLAVCASFAYLWAYDYVNNSSGTFLAGAASSACAGWLAGSSYFHRALPGGIWIAAALGILAALVFGLALFPALYLGAKRVLVTLRVSKLGQPLVRVHKFAEDGCRKIANRFARVYELSYRDRTGYQTWFVQAANLACASAVVLYAPALLAAVSQHAPHFLACLVPASLIAVHVVQAVLGVLSYILLGRFLEKSGVGTEFIAAIASLLLGVYLSSSTVAAGSSIWSTVIVGLLGWCAGFALVFPAAYLAFRFPARYLLASWSTGILVRLHNRAWSSFRIVWVRLGAAYQVLNKVVFVPLRNAVAGAWRKVASVYNWLRAKFLARR